MSLPLELLWGETVVVSLEKRGERRWWLVQPRSESGRRFHALEVGLRDVEFVLAPERVAMRVRDPGYEGAIGFARGTLVDADAVDCRERVRFSQPPPPAPLDPENPPRFVDDAGTPLRRVAEFYGDADCRGWFAS